jgi:hypothetical protein
VFFAGMLGWLCCVVEACWVACLWYRDGLCLHSLCRDVVSLYYWYLLCMRDDAYGVVCCRVAYKPSFAVGLGCWNVVLYPVGCSVWNVTCCRLNF